MRFNVSLSTNELKVINSLYEYYTQNSKWPVAIAFRQKLGRRLVESVVNRKGFSLINKEPKFDNRTEFYELTFAGTFYCPAAKNDIDMLFRYINFITEEFKKNPETQKVNSEQVEDALKLSKEQSKRLIELIYLSNIYGRSASRGEDRWEAGIPDDIEDIVELGNPEKYLALRIKRYIEPTKIPENPSRIKKPLHTSNLMTDKNTPLDIWQHIEAEYGLSKRNVALKINFIRDKFRRNIILRDIKDAVFALENNIPKIAVILSGGVIEEILRCKLESKNISPKKDDFYNYIETSHNNNLIDKKTFNLLHAIRDFRNLVHLREEKSKKDTISNSESSTAINSIFTLIKNLKE